MMNNKKQRSVFTRLVGMQLVSMCITLLIIGVLFGWLLEKYYSGVKEWSLIEQGNRMVTILQDDLVNDDIESARSRIYTLAESSEIDLWIIGVEGNILAGSRLEQEDHTLTLEEAEVTHVLAGNNITKKVVGLDYQNLLVVQPIYNPSSPETQETIGALAMRAPLGGVGETFNNLMRLIMIAGLVAGIIVFIISLSMAKGFAKPLEQLKHAALDIAHKKFRQVAVAPHSEEVDLLVDAFNYASLEIKKTALEQKRLNKIRKDFLSDLSHELRAPLTSLKGFLELLEHPTSKEKREKYRKIMLQDTLYLEHLVSDVLELSKIESNYFSLEKEWVNPSLLVDNALATLELRFEDKNVTINKEIEPGLQLVYLDPQRMHQIILNLLINGLQFSPAYSTLTIRVYTDKENLIYEFSDQGPGIPSEHLPDIWERFYKSDQARTRSRQGSGLGLAIVKQLVEAHKGTVAASSILGKGTTFKLKFPLNKGGVTDA